MGSILVRRHHAGGRGGGEGLDGAGGAPHARIVMTFWTGLAGMAPFYAPAFAALLLALCGMLATRLVKTGHARGAKGGQAEALWPGIAAGAVMLGWMVLVPAPRSWVMPRVAVEYLVVPAGVALLWALGRRWVRGRLLSPLRIAAPGFAAWWLAGSGVARPEFWRVWFAVVGVDWLLRRNGGRVARNWVLVSATLLLGMLVAGAPLVWAGAAAVLVGAGLGVAVVQPEARLGGTVVAVGVVGADLGTGVLVRGRVGFMDLVCGAALLSPWLARWLERAAGRRAGRFGWALSAGAAAVALVGLAWAGAWGVAQLPRL